MKTTREFICIPCCILLNKTKIKGICIKPLYLPTLTGHAWSVANTPVRLYVYTTMCLHHVPWYAKRATGIQTVASSEPEVYKPGAGNHWRVVCVGAVPLKPSNHAITLHFVTQFNLRKETLFRGLNIGLCSRTFVALNLESVSFLVKQPVTPQCRPRSSKDHTLQHCIPCLRQDSGAHVRLSQIRKCP